MESGDLRQAVFFLLDVMKQMKDNVKIGFNITRDISVHQNGRSDLMLR